MSLPAFFFGGGTLAKMIRFTGIYLRRMRSEAASRRASPAIPERPASHPPPLESLPLSGRGLGLGLGGRRREDGELLSENAAPLPNTLPTTAAQTT